MIGDGMEEIAGLNAQDAAYFGRSVPAAPTETKILTPYEVLEQRAQNGNPKSKFPGGLERELTTTGDGMYILGFAINYSDALDYAASVFAPSMEPQPEPLSVDAAVNTVLDNLGIYRGLIDLVDEVKERAKLQSND